MKHHARKRIVTRYHIYREMLDLKLTDSVLDLGCGEGLLISQFKGECRQITGVDRSASALKVAARINPECRFIKGDILEVDLPIDSYDVVYCFEVLQYIKWNNLVFRKMLQLARRAIIFSVPNYDSLWAQIVKVRQARFGVRGYPDSPVVQWMKIKSFQKIPNCTYEYHSFADLMIGDFGGKIRFALRKILRHRLFIVGKILLENPLRKHSSETNSPRIDRESRI